MSIDKIIHTALITSILLLGALTSARAAVPKIAKVQVTESTMASQVEIVADAPVTYTYYVIPAPPRAVVDIALADPSPVARQMQVDSPLITGITLDRQETASVTLTRVTISLTQDAYIAVRSAPEDKGRLLVTLVKKIVVAPEPTGSAEQEQAVEPSGKLAANTPTKAAPGDELDDLTAEPAPAPKTSAATSTKAVAAPTPPAVSVPVPVAVPTPAPSFKSPKNGDKVPPIIAPAALPTKADLKPVVPGPGEQKPTSPITVTATGVHISSHAPVNKPHVFRLTGPNRLVIDIPGSKGAFRKTEIPCNRFGINKVRVGIYPDKVRFVFDSDQSPTPPYRIEKTQSGLLVTFGK
jgi:type IV pilus assembly protein PilQ